MGEGSIDTMDFEAFRALRSALLQDKSLKDMGEHNLYASLPQSFPGRFDPIPQSALPKAKHRCHIAEEFLARWGMGESHKRRASVCEGVRSALGAVFAALASEHKRVLIPSDVYPEYARLAALAGVSRELYSARLGAPSDEALGRVDAALLCDPLKPWGGALEQSEADRLSAWAGERPADRLLIVDAAYDIDGSEAVRRWREGAGALVIASLSKGWLLPKRAGCALAPAGWEDRIRRALGALPNQEACLRQAFEALSVHPDRPERVRLAVRDLAEFAIASLGEHGVGLRAQGYFVPSCLPASAWLERGVIAIPASVYGSAEARSFLSVLQPVSKARQRS